MTTTISPANQELNDWITTVKLGACLTNFDIVSGALKAFNSPAFAAQPSGTDDDASEFQECLEDLVYATSIRDWNQIRQIADRIDGQFTTVTK